MQKIGIIGAGNMGAALIKGIIASGHKGSFVTVSDSDKIKLDNLKKLYKVNITTDNNDVMAKSDIVIFAVKPQVAETVASSLAKPEKMPLIVSIMAGISTDTLLKYFGGKTRVVRVMPNTPALVQKGCSAISAGKYATEKDLEAVKEIFSCVGSARVMDEKMLNAVTALSGSGPAYFFIILEALSDAGVKAGLPRDVALEFAAQTAIGSAQMVLETGMHPGALKDMVTSPAGTTIAAVAVMEEYGVRAAMINAVEAALHRASELG